MILTRVGCGLKTDSHYFFCVHILINRISDFFSRDVVVNHHPPSTNIQLLDPPVSLFAESKYSLPLQISADLVRFFGLETSTFPCSGHMIIRVHLTPQKRAKSRNSSVRKCSPWKKQDRLDNRVGDRYCHLNMCGTRRIFSLLPRMIGL